jgi:hypothetical protein
MQEHDRGNDRKYLRDIGVTSGKGRKELDWFMF